MFFITALGDKMLDIDLQSHKPLRELVYEQLKNQILEGKIAPGTRMMEVNLAEEMGVSRTPVREAIRKLEKDGLVVIEPRRGAYASEISVQDIIDTLTVRSNLEALAASIAAEYIQEEELAELERITDLFEEAINNGEVDDMVELDEQFHRQIVVSSRNKTLGQLSETVALRFRYLYYDDFSRYRHMPNEHNRIIAALRSKKPEIAADAARIHTDNLKQFVINEGSTAFKLKRFE